MYRNTKYSLEKLPPFNWIKDAKLYNHKYEKIPSSWIVENVDIIVLNFSIKGKDRNGILLKFYEIYENAKHINIPIEVINVPMDETAENMRLGYEQQANWFTLKFDDPLIITLLYRYEITSVPHLLAMKTDCSVVSTHAIMDVEDYGKNALITWLSTAASITTAKRLSKEIEMYGPNWKYFSEKNDYQAKFGAPGVDDTKVILKSPGGQ